MRQTQATENPWDVFESIFAVDTVHEGTITEIADKGAIIALQYGVEGFVTPRHMAKQDGSLLKLMKNLNLKC